MLAHDPANDVLGRLDTSQASRELASDVAAAGSMHRKLNEVQEERPSDMTAGRHDFVLEEDNRAFLLYMRSCDVYELPGEDKASCTSKEQCGRDIYE